MAVGPARQPEASQAGTEGDQFCVPGRVTCVLWERFHEVKGQFLQSCHPAYCIDLDLNCLFHERVILIFACFYPVRELLKRAVWLGEVGGKFSTAETNNTYTDGEIGNGFVSPKLADECTGLG